MEVRAATAALLAIFALGIGVMVGYLIGIEKGRSDTGTTAPVCVSEDACTVDYHDGAWWIEGVRVSG